MPIVLPDNRRYAPEPGHAPGTRRSLTVPALALLAHLLTAPAPAQPVSTAESQLSEAIRLSQATEYQASLELLDKVIQRAPDSVRAYDWVMRNYTALRDPEGGRVYFERLGERYPQQPCRCLGILNFLESSKRHAEELELGLACADRYPDLPPIFEPLVSAAFALKRLEYAAAILEGRLRKQPDSPGLLYGLGSIEALIPERRAAGEERLLRARQLARDYAEIDDSLYLLYADQKRNREAAEAAERLLGRARRTGDLDWQLRASIRLASRQTMLGQFQQAQETLEATLVFGKPLLRPATEMFQRESLGSLYYYLDRYEDALRQYQQALRLATELKQARAVSRVLNWIGVLQRAMGRHAAGLDYYQRALKVAIDQNDDGGQIRALSNLSLTQLDLGNLNQSIEYRERAMEMIRTHSLPPGVAGRIAIDLASAYRQSGQAAKALETFAATLQFADSAEDSHTALRAYVERATLHTESGHFLEAESDLEQARKLTGAVGVASEEARLWIAAGRLELRRRNADAALASFHQAMDRATAGGRPGSMWEAHAGLADAYWLKGDLPATFEHRQKALEIIERVRSQLMTPDQRSGFLASKVRLYKDTALVLARMGRTRDAFEAAEQGRARSMLEMLSSGDAGKTLSAESADEERKLRKKLRDAQNAIFDLSIEGKASAQRMKAARADVENAESELERFWASNRPEEPTLAIKPAGLNAIQEGLARGSALLHYTMHPEGGLLFVVTRDQIRRYPLPRSTALEAQIKRLRDALAAPPSRLTQSQWIADARSLYQSLIGPARSALAGVREWIIVPDGLLHMLPYEILLTDTPGSSGAGSLSYLGRGTLTRYVPSASVMASLQSKPSSKPEGLLAVGGAVYGSGPATSYRWIGDGGIRPLAHSEREIRSVEPFYRNHPMYVLTGEQASEASLRRVPKLESIGTLHFAVHGLLNEEHPRLSGLLLSRPQPGEADDGFLQAFEIAGMKLHAGLVVLSACQTALGKQVTGEGIAGLTQAFFSAGARSVVASLWSVYDESTALLMESFHRGMQQEKLSAPEALRRARNEIMARPEFSHPYYWAPFVLIGAPR